ncbi:MAG: hypothetical protein HWD61_10940 [Parachlamydiaceae bacterium]|nr:MAG: hypothetical protein HWD61_10940 [Parachlamydiaceae bacterium]
MDPRIEVYQDLNPHFKYLGPENHSKVLSASKNGQRISISRIYQNCVACNVQRFTDEEMKKIL